MPSVASFVTPFPFFPLWFSFASLLSPLPLNAPSPFVVFFFFYFPPSVSFFFFVSSRSFVWVLSVCHYFLYNLSKTLFSFQQELIIYLTPRLMCSRIRDRTLSLFYLFCHRTQELRESIFMCVFFCPSYKIMTEVYKSCYFFPQPHIC